MSGIGERIRAARRRLGAAYTQRWLAEKVGVTTAAISQWENGGSPDLNKIALLRRALRVTFVWLLVGDGDPPDLGDPAVTFEDGKEDRAIAALSAAAAKRPRRGTGTGNGRLSRR